MVIAKLKCVENLTHSRTKFDFNRDATKRSLKFGACLVHQSAEIDIFRGGQQCYKGTFFAFSQIFSHNWRGERIMRYRA